MFGRLNEIDLVEEPEEWIEGFDAGFAGRPFAYGNTEQYHKGYLDDQHEWLDQTTSPATASVFTEIPSPARFDATLIDPQLLALDASDDDPFKTPTQSSQTIHRFSDHGSTVNNDHDDIPPLFLRDSSQKTVQISSPPSPPRMPPTLDGTYHSNGPRPHADFNFSRLDLSLSSPGGKLQTASSTVHEQQFRTPTKGRAARRRVPVPASIQFALSRPLSPFVGSQDRLSMSPGVRRSLSEAKRARYTANFLSSQGDDTAAAVAAAKATTCEKKARRLQSKNNSQRRIRAKQRANPVKRA